jgi:hypothetical protein
MTIDEDKEKCPRCEMDNLMIGMTVAHIACGGIEDESKRGECNEWAAGIDPAKMSAREMMKETYRRAGIDGLSRFPEMHNKMIRELVIEEVGDKLTRGETISKEENDLYIRYTKKEMEQGI